ncbi:unnamed protein product [Schistocephalus solidus]|uniref:MAU2 chromatid cohesion factor homolog n=1 Tax=Schistocephalus solidus TaxID=70667 RepID=A0A183TI72_SCHSO|nr:unnamed protein product [Schistocephalus solidus]
MNPRGSFPVSNATPAPGPIPPVTIQRPRFSGPESTTSTTATQPLIMRTRISPTGVTIVSAPATENQLSAAQVHECYASLLGLAEYFRTINPPNIRLVIHCLKSILSFKLPVNYEARTHLQLGKVLFLHSKNEEQIKFHLEKARILGAHLRAPDDVIKFEAADLLADFYERKGKRYEATCILNDAMRLSNNNPYWNCRLLLKRAQAHMADRDVNSACELLAMGSEFAQLHSSEYTRGLFLLSKCMLLLASRQLPEVTNTLTVANRLIEKLNGTAYQREALRLFYLIIHVSLYLLAGQAKSAHPILRQLHQSIQLFMSMEEDLSSTKEVDRFQWMPREYMVILIYLISVMQLMQSGMLERAQHSAEKGLTQIEKLSIFDNNPLLTVFHLSLLEHTVMGRLVMGAKTRAVQDIGHACKLSQSCPALMYRRLPQLHTLIGLYAMSMNCMNQAENQFKLALRYIANSQPGSNARPGTSLAFVGASTTDLASTLSGGPRDSLSVLICLNLALVYIRKGDTTACELLLNEVFTAGLPVLEGCYCLRAAAAYVRGFQAFYENRLQDAKAALRETMRLGNEEELNRLSTSALITLGQINLNERNIVEAHKQIGASITAANKLPDIGIQLWATALLKDVANLMMNPEEERLWFDEHDKFSKMVIYDHMKATASPEHRLIEVGFTCQHAPHRSLTRLALGLSHFLSFKVSFVT